MTERILLLQRAADRAIFAQERAADLKAAGRLRWKADDPDCPDVMRLAALLEEAGEVARCVHDGDTVNLMTELAQLAGVALAWIVALDRPPDVPADQLTIA